MQCVSMILPLLYFWLHNEKSEKRLFPDTVSATIRDIFKNLVKIKCGANTLNNYVTPKLL